MKKFRFYFSLPVWILLSLSLLCSLGGIGINIFNLIVAREDTIIFKFVAFLVLCTILVGLILSVMIHSTYKIKDGKLYLYFGFINNTFNLSEALNLTHFEDKDMLVLFFNQAEYTRIVIKKQDFNAFANSIIEENEKIVFSSANKDNN